MKTITNMGIIEEPELETTLRQLAQISYLAEQQPLLQLFLDCEGPPLKDSPLGEP